MSVAARGAIETPLTARIGGEPTGRARPVRSASPPLPARPGQAAYWLSHGSAKSVTLQG